jgi:N-acetylglutamate synthase-like GNAT family acetyltransferase
MLEGEMAIEIKVVSGYEELERWVAARNEVVPDDTDTVALKVLRRATQEGRVDLIAYDDGEVVGVGLLAGGPVTVRSTHPYVEVLVPDRYRGRGVGTALLHALSDRLRLIGKDGLEVEARSDDAYSLGYLERRGFVEVDRWTQLVLELDTYKLAESTPPTGVEIAWLSDRPDLLEGLFAVARASGRDLGGSFQAWQVYELGDPRIVLDLTAIALAEDEVVGYSTFVQFADEGTGGQRAMAVLPAWEERGIARVLTQTQIAVARRAGLETLVAWARPWQYQDLYESLGYEARTASIDFQGPLQ